MFFRKSAEMPGAGNALPGRAEALATAKTHLVPGHPLQGPHP